MNDFRAIIIVIVIVIAIIAAAAVYVATTKFNGIFKILWKVWKILS